MLFNILFITLKSSKFPPILTLSSYFASLFTEKTEAIRRDYSKAPTTMPSLLKNNFQKVKIGVPWWLSVLRTWCCTAVAQVQSLSLELLHATDTVKKKKNKGKFKESLPITS